MPSHIEIEIVLIGPVGVPAFRETQTKHVGPVRGHRRGVGHREDRATGVHFADGMPVQQSAALVAGQLHGFARTPIVAKAIAKEVGIKAEFAEGSFDSLLAGVDAKKYDTVADQISATDERKAKYDFSEPYTYSYGVVITSKENPKNVTSFDDVKGLRAAETGTSNWNKTAQEKGAAIVQVNDFGQQVDAITSGRADVSLNDGLAALDYLKQKPDADIKIAAKSEKTPAAYLPFRKGSDDLVKEVNKAIVKLQKDGTLTKISEKYFGEDFSQE